MGPFWRGAAGGFAGKLLGSVFIACCALLGFGPEQWAAFMIAGLPHWFTPSLARAIFILFGMVTAAILWWPRRRSAAPILPAQAQQPEPSVPSDPHVMSGARVQIKNFAVVTDSHPRVIYELQNVGEVAATGLAHSVWYGAAAPALQAGDEWRGEIIDPLSTLKKQRHLLSHDRDPERTQHPLAPILSNEEWTKAINGRSVPAVIGVTVVYWNGRHSLRRTESRHRFNLDNGIWVKDYYREE
jgi:hypothetical protein